MNYINDANLIADYTVIMHEKDVCERNAIRAINESILMLDNLDDQTYYAEGVLEKIGDFIKKVVSGIWKFIVNIIKGFVRLITAPFDIQVKWAEKDSDDSGGGNKNKSSDKDSDSSKDKKKKKKKKKPSINTSGTTRNIKKEYYNFRNLDDFSDYNSFVDYNIQIPNLTHYIHKWMKTLNDKFLELYNERSNDKKYSELSNNERDILEDVWDPSNDELKESIREDLETIYKKYGKHFIKEFENNQHAIEDIVNHVIKDNTYTDKHLYEGRYGDLPKYNKDFEKEITSKIKKLPLILLASTKDSSSIDNTVDDSMLVGTLNSSISLCNIITDFIEDDKNIIDKSNLNLTDTDIGYIETVLNNPEFNNNIELTSDGTKKINISTNEIMKTKPDGLIDYLLNNQKDFIMKDTSTSENITVEIDLLRDMKERAGKYTDNLRLNIGKGDKFLKYDYFKDILNIQVGTNRFNLKDFEGGGISKLKSSVKKLLGDDKKSGKKIAQLYKNINEKIKETLLKNLEKAKENVDVDLNNLTDSLIDDSTSDDLKEHIMTHKNMLEDDMKQLKEIFINSIDLCKDILKIKTMSQVSLININLFILAARYKDHLNALYSLYSICNQVDFSGSKLEDKSGKSFKEKLEDVIFDDSNDPQYLDVFEKTFIKP